MASDALEISIEAHALNIDASEHPPGAYRRIFNLASRKIVKARGSDYLKITKPKKIDDGIFGGRILIWTNISLKGRWLDINSEDDLSPELRGRISIPSEAKANYRSFDYIFVEQRHRMYFETRNEFGETLGATTAQRAFAYLFSQEVLGADITDVAVTLLPEKGALDKVLRLPGLRTLFVRVARPNDDTSSASARQRVLDELTAAHAKSVDETWHKAAGADRLIITPAMRERAEVAAEVGLVTGTGRNSEGEKNQASTQSFPRRYLLLQTIGGGSFYQKLRSKLHDSL